MSFQTDFQEFINNGLGKARNFADQYVDIQLEKALNKEKLRNVDQDSGTYVPSDLERERQFAGASFIDGPDVFGVPRPVALGGAALLVLLVVMNNG